MDQPFFIPEKNEIDNKINVAVYYALLIYIVSLFSEYIPVISNIMMALVFVASLVLAFQKGGSQLFYRNKALTGIILFFLIQFLSVLFSQNKKEGFTILSSVVPFFLFAVSFCFIEFKQSTWNRLLLFFAVITTLASVIGFGAGVYNSVTLHDNGYLYNDNICFVLGKQAVYFAFYVSIAILIYIYHLITNENKKSAAWIYLAICWLFIIIFLLASRTAMFGLLAILCIYLGTILIQRKKYMEICILFLSLAIGAVILIKLFPKTLNRFKGTTETSFQFDNQNTENHFNATFDKTKWNSSNTRAAIWTCAVEVWR
ncbi:MAG TPA: O-antigen ligase family protein, partial [Bacteroidia bacterium]|nr:O-antigen ligase family protein [Bacteroidia bacterium]